MQLIELVKGYLGADGWNVSDRTRRCVVGQRETIGGSRDRVFTWVSDEDELDRFASRAPAYISEFADIQQKYPASRRFFVVPHRRGIDVDFQRFARYVGVRIIAAPDFFDTELLAEADSKAASAFRAFNERGKAALNDRVPQPYDKVDGGAGDDLLPVLVDELSRADGPSVYLAVGPAGIGKSHLFDSLFASLYGRFQQDKARLVVSRRPVPLIPELLQRTRSDGHRGDLSSLLDDFLATQFTRPLSRDVFVWRLTNGSMVWMLDGLDEVVARDPDFFDDDLLKYVTIKGATNAKIVICLRNSLLATDSELRDFRTEYPTEVETYRLLPWQADTLGAFVGKKLAGQTDQFFETIHRTPGAADLASIPFYAELLIERFVLGELGGGEVTPVGLVEEALAGAIDRDIDKGIVDAALVDRAEILELLEYAAVTDFQAGNKGVDAADLREAAQIVVAGIPDAHRPQVEEGLLQLALFSRTGNRVTFDREIMAQYLLGRAIAANLHTDIWRSLLDDYKVPDDWLTLDAVALCLLEVPGGPDRLAALASVAGQPTVVNNLVKIARRLAVPRILAGFPLEAAELDAIEFHDLDFTDLSFRNADLTDTSFVDCCLRRCHFENAILDNTAFLGSSTRMMEGAAFGPLQRFHSIRHDGATIEEHQAAAEWLAVMTNVSQPVREPCPGARQLQFLFGKFVHANGQGRRHWVDEQGILAGKRHLDPETVLDAAVRYGYLDFERARHRYARADGDSYDEMVRFRVDMTTSTAITEMLNSICDRPACNHI